MKQSVPFLSSHASVWFRQADVNLFVSGLAELARTNQGSCTLVGYSPTGEDVCSLAMGVTERASPFALSVALTHRERVGESDDVYDHHVRTQFDLDPSAMPGLQQDLQELMKYLFDRLGLVVGERPPAKEMPLNPEWPGLQWRFLTRDWRQPDRAVYHMTGDGWTWFDELVVGDWLHIEWMHSRHWWMRLGDARISIALPPGKPPVISIERDNYETRPSEAEAQANRDLIGDDDDPYGPDDDE